MNCSQCGQPLGPAVWVQFTRENEPTGVGFCSPCHDCVLRRGGASPFYHRPMRIAEAPCAD